MDIVRFGIIGMGGMGNGHARNMPEVHEARLTAVCDIAPEALTAATEAYEVPGFAAHEELLDSGLVDAVIIATPHYFHPPIAVDAMRRGIHVLSEKPIAVRVSGADRMIAAAQETGVVFAADFGMRALPVYQAVKRLIDEGRLGPLYRTYLLDARFRSQAYYDSASWRATWRGEGGGVLLNQAPHAMDMLTWLGGTPSRVMAQINTRQHDIEVEDEAAAMLEYPNGAHGYLCVTVNESPTDRRLELCGEKGKVIADDQGLRFWEVKPGVRAYSDATETMWGGPDVTEVDVALPERDSGHAAIVRNVAHAILYGEPLIVPGPEGLASLELTNAILLSGHSGAPVSIPVDRAAYDAFIAEKQASSRIKVVDDKRITDPNLG
jgi:predicted dehydrogenase